MTDLRAPVRSPDQDRQQAIFTLSTIDSGLSLADRLSLRLALRLLLRGERRRRGNANSAEHTRLLENERARERRERHAAIAQVQRHVRV